MENPAEEITSVVLRLTTAITPEAQQAAVELYMTPDVAFHHPVCFVPSGVDSRNKVLGIYQWYRVLSPRTDVAVQSIVFDSSQSVVYLEIVQWFKLFFLPIHPAPARLITRLTLRKLSGLYYISKQEDFYHPNEFAALLIPPLAPFVRIALVAGGIVSNVFATGAGILGFWRTTTTTQKGDSAPSEAGLYDEE